jgi:mobilome CxxCx(11)CxxC protein
MAQSRSAAEDDLKVQAWGQALHAHGTSEVFRKRADRLSWRTRLRDFLGIALPVGLGVVAANTNQTVTAFAIPIVGILAGLQLLLVIWSIMSRWDEEYWYSINAMRENSSLCTTWERIARLSGPALFDRTMIQDQLILDRDSSKGITEKEKRFGMRAGLFRYAKACAGCGEVPKTMKRGSCGVCGDF